MSSLEKEVDNQTKLVQNTSTDKRLLKVVSQHGHIRDVYILRNVMESKPKG